MEARAKVILVTGATGRQGGAVARHLLKDGWKGALPVASVRSSAQ